MEKGGGNEYLGNSTKNTMNKGETGLDDQCENESTDSENDSIIHRDKN